MTSDPKPKKSTIAKPYKDNIRKQVKRHLVNHDDIELNSGQLKFLKDLMIRSLAISTRKRIHQPTQLLDFLEKNILKNNDEVISFFDSDKNVAAFLNSPHGDSLSFPRTFQAQFGYPPYLLLQKTQDVMEQALLDYIKEPFNDEDNKEMLERKLESYVQFLFGATLYEIFLRDFCNKINHDYLKKLDTLEDGTNEHLQKLKLLEKKLPAFKNEDELKELLGLLEVQTKEASDYIFAAILVPAYVLYFYRHQTNFYAILRIISMIEFVNINEANNPSSNLPEKRLAIEKAINWHKYTSEWLRNGELFTVHAQGKNMGILYNEWNRLYRKYIAQYSNEPKKQPESFQEYLHVLKKYRISKCITYKEKEKMLWDIALNLALPIYKAADAICDLPKTVLEKKEKRNSKNCK